MSRLIVQKIGLLFLILSFGFPVFAESDAGNANESAYGVPNVDDLKGNALKFHELTISQTPLYNDPELHQFANEIADKIGAASKNPNVNYRVFILDSEGVNAFTPGYGLIYFYRGLISLLTTEGQLAAVIAHEIGHNVGNHISRSKSKRILGNIGEFLASVVVGNSGVGSAIDMANLEREQAFSRDLELEADDYAAQYLFATGYDPEEMIAALSILKDFSLLTDKIEGTNLAQYHGVFAGHPSNDIRLRELVEQAGTLPPGEAHRGRLEMREHLEGMVFGRNARSNIKPDEESYLNRGLGITLVYPKEWSRSVKGKKIILSDSQKSVQLQIQLEKTKDKSLNSTEILEARHPNGLSDKEKIQPEATKDLGAMGKVDNKRVAAVRVGRNTYYFLGLTKTGTLSKEQDEQFVEIIKSFRRATKDDISEDDVKRIAIRRLQPGETFADLAQSRELGKFTEEYIRVMNGYYPRGEAEPGTYLKVIAPEEPQ